MTLPWLTLFHSYKNKMSTQPNKNSKIIEDGNLIHCRNLESSPTSEVKVIRTVLPPELTPELKRELLKPPESIEINKQNEPPKELGKLRLTLLRLFEARNKRLTRLFNNGMYHHSAD